MCARTCERFKYCCSPERSGARVLQYCGVCWCSDFANSVYDRLEILNGQFGMAVTNSQDRIGYSSVSPSAL